MITLGLVVVAVGLVGLGFWELRALYRVGSVEEAWGLLVLPERVRLDGSFTSYLRFVLAVNHDVSVMVNCAERGGRGTGCEERVTRAEITRRAHAIRYRSLALLPRLAMRRAGGYTVAGLGREYEELLGCFENLQAIRATVKAHG